MPVLTKTTQSNFEDIFNIIKPIFLQGVNPDNLFTTNVYVGVSIIKNTPLLTNSGNYQLVSFLGSLPKPCIIVLGDYLNRHIMKAMAKLKKGNKMPSDEKAIETALKAGDEYHQSFTRSLNRLEMVNPQMAAKITILRWRDVENEVMKKQQKILHSYYQTNEYFKQKIGERSFNSQIEC